MLTSKLSRDNTLESERDENCRNENNDSLIRKQGYLRKLKSMKKKYFVLRKEAEKGGPSRIDYYGSEKKFKNNPNGPKRSIVLKECFSINRKCSSKYKYAIALYTNEDCLTLILESEPELNDWLQALLELQTGLEGNRQVAKPFYEHVWQVTLSKKGLGETRNMTGIYRLCLTAKSLLLFKVPPGLEKPNPLEFPLIIIRRCGHSESFFVLELGRSSCIGPGELWVQTEDTATAHNMHEAILSAMKASKGHEEYGPLPRPRSASTSENSKPISSSRRPTSGGITSPSAVPPSISSSISYASISTSAAVRDRCDSLPSRSRTVSEGTSRGSGLQGECNPTKTTRPHEGLRSAGVLYSRTYSYSPPNSNNILSPSSGACSTDSAGSSLSVDDYDSVAINGLSSDFYLPSSQISRDTSAIPSEPPITEEEVLPDDYLTMDPSAQSQLSSISCNISAQVSNVQMQQQQLHQHQQQQQLRSSLNLSLHTQNAVSSSPVSSPVLVQNPTGGQTQSDEGYFPMSPVGSTESTGYKSCSTRSSSIMERCSVSSDVPNGYVPMAPGVSGLEASKSGTTDSEGYLEMSSLSASLPKSEVHLGSSPKPPVFVPSLSSSIKPVLSEEFKLEKVKSYFTPSEDEESFDFIKPVRSYSMGSRPQVYARGSSLTKLYHNYPQSSRSSRLGLASHAPSGAQSENEAIRVRAYSMGSQTTSGSERGKEKRKNSLKQCL